MIYTKCTNCHKGTGFKICTCGYDKEHGKMLNKTQRFFNRYFWPGILIASILSALAIVHYINK